MYIGAVRFSVRVACVLGIATHGSWVEAQPVGPSFSLAYSVPSNCPEREDFVASLVSRSRGAHEVPESPRVALAVELEGSGERAWGTLTVKLADGQESRREIPAALCSEVLSSMAVISAMILDGGGLDATPPASDVAVSPAPPTTPAQPPQQVLPDAAPPRPPPSRSERSRFSALLGVGPQSGVAPSVVARYFAGLGLVFERASLVSPTVDLTASLAQSGREQSDFGDARFRLLAVNLTVCPLRWSVSSSLVLRPCVPLELGSLRGIGDNTAADQTQYMPWLGVGAAGRAEYALSRVVRLELEARATVLAWSDRFVFEPDYVVHDVPRVALGLWIGPVLVQP